MRRAGWVCACVVGGVLVALALYGACQVTTFSRLPHLREMTAACGAGAAGAAPSPAPAARATPSFATPAKCKTYFAEVDAFQHPTTMQTVITGLLAAFIFLVLRLRVYPFAFTSREAGPRRR
jgi:hypothetical protein